MTISYSYFFVQNLVDIAERNLGKIENEEEEIQPELRCSFCPTTFKALGALKTHRKSHIPRKCSYCGELVFSKDKRPVSRILSDHEKSCRRRIAREQTKSKGVKRHYCKTCNQIMSRGHSSFQKHSCIVECVHCNQRFNHMRAVNNHKCSKRLMQPNEFNYLKELGVKYTPL